MNNRYVVLAFVLLLLVPIQILRSRREQSSAHMVVAAGLVGVGCALFLLAVFPEIDVAAMIAGVTFALVAAIALAYARAQKPVPHSISARARWLWSPTTMGLFSIFLGGVIATRLGFWNGISFVLYAYGCGLLLFHRTIIRKENRQ